MRKNYIILVLLVLLISATLLLPQDRQDIQFSVNDQDQERQTVHHETIQVHGDRVIVLSISDLDHGEERLSGRIEVCLIPIPNQPTSPNPSVCVYSDPRGNRDLTTRDTLMRGLYNLSIHMEDAAPRDAVVTVTLISPNYPGIAILVSSPFILLVERFYFLIVEDRS